MSRYLLPILMLFFIVPGHYSDAALSPEAQQVKEKSVVRESEQLEGHSITSITLYEDEIGRYYEVETKVRAEEKCTYKFRIEYSMNLYALLGMVGPKKFSVEMDGEPSCQALVAELPPEDDLKTTIYKFISETYGITVADISRDMSLYRVLEKQQKPTMDFRILVLRQQFEEELGCHIETDRLVTIRTVGQLLTLSNEYCAG